MSNQLVSLVDLPPTFLDVADVSPSASMDGRSLVSGPEPNTVFAEFGRPYEGTLGNLADSMFTNIDLQSETLADRLADYQERIDRYDRGLQAARTKDYKLVVPTRGDNEFYRLEAGSETLTENAAVESELRDELERNLGSLPTGNYSEDLPKHIEEHLIKMGYL